MKFNKTLAGVCVASILSGAFAHDFWVNGENGENFKAHIGYGHDFPAPEMIPENRVKLFNPLHIISKDGKKTELKQKGENYQFETAKLAAGSYVLEGTYKPTFWSKDSDGKWHMDGTRQNTKNVEYCQLAVMNAKSVISIDNAKADDFIYEPIGHQIELVPLDDPFDLKVDKPFKLKAYMNGKPVKTGKVTGTFEGFLQDKHAFLGTTDLKGEIEVMALRPGKWMFEVTVEKPHDDKKVCEDAIYLGTLTLVVK